VLFVSLADLEQFKNYTDSVALINAGRGMALDPILWFEVAGQRQERRTWARTVAAGTTTTPEQMMLTPEDHTGRKWFNMIQGALACVLEYRDVYGNTYRSRREWVRSPSLETTSLGVSDLYSWSDSFKMVGKAPIDFSL
jgi:hypothetical protein